MRTALFAQVPTLSSEKVGSLKLHHCPSPTGGQMMHCHQFYKWLQLVVANQAHALSSNKCLLIVYHAPCTMRGALGAISGEQNRHGAGPHRASDLVERERFLSNIYQ